MEQVARHPPKEHVTLHNDRVQVTVQPERGGNMTSLVSRDTGREFFLQPEEQAPQPVSYGDAFDEHPPSGFDECFPTVASTSVAYSAHSEAVSLPDHGELWCRAWDYETRGEALLLWVEGEQLPYRFEKEIRLREYGVELNYTVENQGDYALPYVWSAHPLLRTNGAERIELPADVDAVSLYWASDDCLGESGDRLPWPVDEARSLLPDLSRVSSDVPDLALKCFTDGLSTGAAQLCYSDPEEALRFVFDPDSVPYLGLWLCYDGWPPDRSWSQRTVAIEPTSSPTDALADAIAQEACPVLTPGDAHSWTLKLQLVPHHGSS
jgi:galactose mutarotase-like enzyme